MHNSPAHARLEPKQLGRPNAGRMREMGHRSILGMDERIVALEARDVLTDSHQQAVICISKMLEIMCTEFKAYVASFGLHKAARQEQTFSDEH